jgi:hypothetical protein
MEAMQRNVVDTDQEPTVYVWRRIGGSTTTTVPDMVDHCNLVIHNCEAVTNRERQRVLAVMAVINSRGGLE